MAKDWISFPRTEGEASRQAHTDFPSGTFEREMGKEGFWGPSTHFYHTHPPTGWTKFQGPLRPQAFDLNRLTHDRSCPWKSKIILKNNHCIIACWSTDKNMDHLVRNADGDQILFVHEGEGDLYCDFGHFTYREGDYILLPRSTMWRLEPSAKATTLLMIEAVNDSFRLPDKGMLGQHAIFDPALLDVPQINDKFKAQQSEKEWKVAVKRRQMISTITYPFNPLDAKGWKGDLLVCRINWRDIRPVMSHRYHLPPSVHTTFLSSRFVICTFVPRPFETDPGALKVPFYHNNDDYDEFLFYHKGQFFSRDNIKPGMTTLHPFGFTHGPHPKALANADHLGGKMTDEVAVMVDTRDPLDVMPDAESVESKEYVDSWKTEI
jgi:homogentisate 1,2-dioxygenase